MNVEIVEAYLIKKSADAIPSGWSMHVYVSDWLMDIRGIQLVKHKGKWSMRMPFLYNYDIDEKRTFTYPVISFSNIETLKKLKEEIKNKSIEYVEKNKLKTKLE